MRRRDFLRALAAVPLAPLAAGAVSGAWTRPDVCGISLKFIKAFEINPAAYPSRVDLLYGWKALRPECAVVVTSEEYEYVPRTERLTREHIAAYGPASRLPL